MKKFIIGDLVIRTNSNFRDCEVGKTYEVESMKIVSGLDKESLVIKGATGSYDSDNFKLHPISRSPLMEALK